MPADGHRGYCIGLAARGRSTWLSASAQRGRSSWPLTAVGWTGTAARGSSAALLAVRGSPSASGCTHYGTPSSPLCSFDAGVPLRDVQEAASHADPRTTMCYDKS